MAKTYDERLAETRARSLEENMRLYRARSRINRPAGVLETVILEQIRAGVADEESDSCTGSRLDYGPDY
jgi:hypothetical protein